MTQLTKQIHNVETNEIQIIELTEEEVQLRLEESEAHHLSRLAQKESVEAQKKQTLDKLVNLGLNEDDLKVLGLA